MKIAIAETNRMKVGQSPSFICHASLITVTNKLTCNCDFFFSGRTQA